jgi:hypothetical protein
MSDSLLYCSECGESVPRTTEPTLHLCKPWGKSEREAAALERRHRFYLFCWVVGLAAGVVVALLR